MKTNFLALSLLISSSAFSSDKTYELKSVPHTVAYQEMAVANDSTGTPAALQGIWWMNGNPLSDEMISFANVKWEAVKEDGEVVGYTGSLPVYDSKVWSWHDSPAGHKLYDLVRKVGLVYVAQFNKDFSYGVITPTFKFGHLPTVGIPPTKLLTFAMRKVSDDEYSRDSLIAGLKTQYRFRRVVNADGTLIQATFDEFLNLVETENAFFPVCKADRTPTTLPTTCAQ